MPVLLLACASPQNDGGAEATRPATATTTPDFTHESSTTTGAVQTTIVTETTTLTASDEELHSEDLVGVWLVTNTGDTLLSFDQDGRYWQDSGGALAHNPDMVATYEVEGNHVQLEVTSSSISECEAGATGAFRASAVGSALTIEWIEHSCYPEASGLVWEATRLGPDNALVAPLPETIPTNTYPVREGNLRGVWIVDGTSLLFELDGAGHYFLDTSGTLASAPEESGTYAVNVDDDSLELDTVQSGMCRSGDRLIFSDASAFTTAQILRAIAAVATDECGRVQGDTILALVSS